MLPSLFALALLGSPLAWAGGTLGPTTQPKWRALHCAALAGSSPAYILIHGGITDAASSNPLDSPGSSSVQLFDLNQNNWYAPTIENSPASDEKLHPCATNGDASQVLMYAPMLSDNETSHLEILDTTHWSWANPTPSGPTPAPRLGSSLTRVGNNMFLYAGQPVDASGNVDSTSILNDLSTLDTGSLGWTALANGAGLMLHAACYMAATNAMVVFGGASLTGKPYSNVWTYQLDAQTWNVNPTIQNSNSGPSPRALHTAVCLSDQMLVFGGTDTITGTRPVDSTVWSLTGTVANGRTTYAWAQAPISPADQSKGPSARFGHSAVLHDNKMYVYGGVGAANDTNMYILDTEAWKWTSVSVGPNGSSGDKGNTTTVLIASIVSGVFAIIAMGIIAAVGVRNWRRRKGAQVLDDRSGSEAGDGKGGDPATPLGPLDDSTRDLDKDQLADGDSAHDRSYEPLPFHRRPSEPRSPLDGHHRVSAADLEFLTGATSATATSAVAPAGQRPDSYYGRDYTSAAPRGHSVAHPPMAAGRRPRLHSNSDARNQGTRLSYARQRSDSHFRSMDDDMDQLQFSSMLSLGPTDSQAYMPATTVGPIRYMPSPTPSVHGPDPIDSGPRRLSLINPDRAVRSNSFSEATSLSSRPASIRQNAVPIAHPITPPAPPRLNTLFASFQPVAAARHGGSSPTSPNQERPRSYLQGNRTSSAGSAAAAASAALALSDDEVDRPRSGLRSGVLPYSHTADTFVSPLDKIARLQLDHARVGSPTPTSGPTPNTSVPSTSTGESFHSDDFFGQAGSPPGMSVTVAESHAAVPGGTGPTLAQWMHARSDKVDDLEDADRKTLDHEPRHGLFHAG
ncbi:hypothetical protein IWQ60_000266 [Tieghemiomyces parasiticus]|uniref:Galactose oxidase n=1 Tax=Tieghemiomyces parasiticus TaxID=78921 RepID=A0A9W8E307_9FUNG|nr:hypothetical protein IWQ60_000266 [Tieghemiomyces parasiticus]